jgi:hypothetical protein
MSTITSKLVLRFSGVDSDVSLRSDDAVASVSHSLCYQLSDAAKALAALDKWSFDLGDISELDLTGFLEQAQTALLQSPAGGPPLDDEWETADAALALPGHVYLTQWVTEPGVTATSTVFTACVAPLKKKSESEPYFETAMVGGLLVRVDFWIALQIA